MSDLDALFRDANDDLKTGLRSVPIPDFTPPKSRTPLVAAVVVFVVAIGFGAVLLNRGSTPDGEELVVTTAPDVATLAPEPASPAPEPSAPTGDQDEAPDDAAPFASGEVRQITSAEAGEFIMPIPLGSAWSPDEQYLLLYRTGVNGASHIVVDVASGETVAVPAINPPDLEQVWWNPLATNELVYFDGVDLMSWSLATETASVLRTFAECSDADSGLSPAPPSLSGQLGFLCHRSTESGERTESQLIALDGSGGLANQGFDVESAPVLTRSGLFLLQPLDDGSVALVDPYSTGTADGTLEPLDSWPVIDLEGDSFIPVALADGTDALAAAQYQGDIFGNLVVHPLDGAAPFAILDADAAGGFPASGTKLHGSTTTGASIIAVSISNRDAESPLAGKLLVYDFADLDRADPTALEPIFSIDHRSFDNHDYWSDVFVSMSPSGKRLTWSSDQNGDRVNTFVVELPT